MVRARSGISRSGLLGSLAAAALMTAGFVGPAQASATEPAASAQAGPAASARAAVPGHAVTGYWQNFRQRRDRAEDQ